METVASVPSPATIDLLALPFAERIATAKRFERRASPLGPLVYANELGLLATLDPEDYDRVTGAVLSWVSDDQDVFARLWGGEATAERCSEIAQGLQHRRIGTREQQDRWLDECDMAIESWETYQEELRAEARV